MERERLSQLVKDPRLEQLNLELRSPNFFSIIRVEQYEIRHSNFIAWLLDPKGSHNLREIFLKWFLKEVFSSSKVIGLDEFKVDSLSYHSVQVYREFHGIDILIEAGDYVIGIENKVNSKEHSKQLGRYREIVKSNFPSLTPVHVFLTIEGDTPADVEDEQSYVLVDYFKIREIIKNILSNHQRAISERIKIYLEDYLQILQRCIMKDDPLISLAREVYKNHREAIDFIYANRPDRLQELVPIVSEAVTEKGYILQTCGKGIVRFLPSALVTVIPRTGSWNGKESFLFEIDYRNKRTIFKTAISLGNEHNRNVLAKALKEIAQDGRPVGDKWLIHFSDSTSDNLTSEKFKGDDEAIKSVVSQLLTENENIVAKAAELILEVKDQFIG
ncbi:MAG: PD-(D/E)XK nuclease family protein [Saprospiraceae bacterium]|nr:PD-(D/E)XK nuclease family protein [Saprospiraceae bacterium]